MPFGVEVLLDSSGVLDAERSVSMKNLGFPLGVFAESVCPSGKVHLQGARDKRQ
jgi:hypothetical protein